MKAAAALSMRVARLARLTSAAIIARSTAAVDQRSSHRSRGRASGARLRAKARVLWVRGLSLPSMLSGRPTIRPTMDCAANRLFNVEVGGEFRADDSIVGGREATVSVAERRDGQSNRKSSGAGKSGVVRGVHVVD